MMIKRIDEEIERYSLLKHPFYKLWQEGMLSIEQLQGYAKEYMHLVNAIPKMVENVARYYEDQAIASNIEEERKHIQLWKRFANGIGVSNEELMDYKPSMKVMAAINKLLELSNSKYGIVSMYAYESQLPKISISKLEGLVRYYNIIDEDTLEYHKVHAIIDIMHAQVWRRLIDASDDQGMIYNAIESLKAQNQVLDGIYDRYVA